MENTAVTYKKYVEILKKELNAAMGCTEPIALAYCAAKAREVLGKQPKRMVVYASGNIIKNVKSVVVPNTNGLRGIEAATVAGAFYGDANRKLEVIAGIKPKEAEKLSEIIKKLKITVNKLDSEHILDMIVELYTEDESASVRIWDSHTNVVRIEKNGVAINTDDLSGNNEETIIEKSSIKVSDSEVIEETDDYALLNVEDIFDFAKTADLTEVQETLERQISYNMAIAEAGLKGNYGACIGQTYLKQSTDAKIQAKAYASAASDARMGGCEMPVVINSGSGNQGITASVPVVVYARHYGKSREEMLRALLVSNLVTLHLKSGIGRLSAYCGAVSAGVGAGAGIAYLLTGSLEAINHTIVNAVAVTSGIVCDGAKASCAAKIAIAVEAGILGFEMYCDGHELCDGEGLVTKGVENTISNIAILARDGMQETDKTIIEIMTGNK